jgi:hypothetical protein
VVVRLVPTTRRRCRPESGVDHVARTSNELDVEKVQPADITCGRKIGSAESSLAGPSSPGHVPDLLSRRCNFCVLNWVSWVVRWVDGVELARKKGRLLSILAAGSSHRPGWATCTLGSLMGGEPLFALPPRVLVAGRLQCGAARAGVRRGRGECVELAHLAPRLHDWFYARHAEKCPFSAGVGTNGWLAMCSQSLSGVSAVWRSTLSRVAPLPPRGPRDARVRRESPAVRARVCPSSPQTNKAPNCHLTVRKEGYTV